GGERPDLRLHGFGLKLTALRNEYVRVNLGRVRKPASAGYARRGRGSPSAYSVASRTTDYSDGGAAWTGSCRIQTSRGCGGVSTGSAALLVLLAAPGRTLPPSWMPSWLGKARKRTMIVLSSGTGVIGLAKGKC